MPESQFRCALVAALLIATVHSQCDPTWVPIGSLPGTNSFVGALVAWDPDGPGPAGEQLVVGGDFDHAGTMRLRTVGAYDPATDQWSPLGEGFDGQGVTVKALLATGAGELIAGGVFDFSGATSLENIARWNGVGWEPLGFLNGSVWDLAELPNGDVIACGDINGGVVRWTGSAWQPVGGGTFYTVKAIDVAPNGDLIAAGAFSSIGGVSAQRVARWNGLTWQAMNLTQTIDVRAMSVLHNGDVVVGGQYLGVLRWNGAGWQSLGGSSYSPCNASTVLPNGDLVIGGTFAGPGSRIARWDGVAWHALGSGTDKGVAALAVAGSGDLYVGGSFTHAGGLGCKHVARWNGTWSPLSPGLDDVIRDSRELPDGRVIVVGNFSSAGSQRLGGIAVWDGSSWQPLGSGATANIVWQVDAVEVLQNGEIVVGGLFDSVDGVTAGGIARFDGSWHAMLSAPGRVNDLAMLPDGSLLAAGLMQLPSGPCSIARWDGIAWTAIDGACDASVTSLCVTQQGHVYAAGGFQTIGGIAAVHVAQWDGQQWSPLVTPLSGNGIAGVVTKIVEMHDGSLVFGGTFTSIGSLAIRAVARWSGSSWAPLPALPLGDTFFGINDLLVLPDGDLLAGGVTHWSGSTRHLARCNGNSWQTFDGGVTGTIELTTSTSASVQSLTSTHDGSVLVSGRFTEAGGLVSPLVAKLQPTCPASTTPYGSACAGAAGLNELVKGTLPWLGGRFRSRATGIDDALAIAVWAFQPLQLPMPMLHPLGQAGCTLWVQDEILIDFLVADGAVTTEIAIPDHALLLGVEFFHQVVAVHLDASGSIASLTGTNALRATIGWF